MSSPWVPHSNAPASLGSPGHLRYHDLSPASESLPFQVFREPAPALTSSQGPVAGAKALRSGDAGLCQTWCWWLPALSPQSVPFSTIAKHFSCGSRACARPHTRTTPRTPFWPDPPPRKAHPDRPGAGATHSSSARAEYRSLHGCGRWAAAPQVPPGPPTARSVTPPKLIGSEAPTHAPLRVQPTGPCKATIGTSDRGHRPIGQHDNR